MIYRTIPFSSPFFYSLHFMALLSSSASFLLLLFHSCSFSRFSSSFCSLSGVSSRSIFWSWHWKAFFKKEFFFHVFHSPWIPAVLNGLKQARLLFAHSSRPSLFLFHRGCCDCLVRSLHPPTHGTCCVVFYFLCVPCSSDVSDISPEMASYCTYILFPTWSRYFICGFFIGSLGSFDAWTFLLRCFPTSQVVFRPSLLSAVPTCFILFFPFCGLFLHNILISLTPDIPSTVAQQGAFSGFLYSACFSHFSRAFASTYRLWHKPPPADSLAGQVFKL